MSHSPFLNPRNQVNRRDDSTTINFNGANKNLANLIRQSFDHQFSEILDSNFIRLLQHRSFVLYSILRTEIFKD